MELVIKNGKVIDFEKRDLETKDILIEHDKIVKVEPKIETRDAEVIDAKNLYVLPGLIDLHAHLREPGREDEEDLFSGSLSAIKGGFTTVLCMPNTEPAIDNPGLVRYILKKGKELELIDILPVGAITKGRKGLELAELARMKSAGCIAFSDDGNWVKNSLLMRRAMEYSLMLDLPLILHCEDEELTKDGLMNEGSLSIKLGLHGMPRCAEEIAVQRDIKLAKLTNARIHITHVSCKETIEVIKRAKHEGIKITSDTCPHYLILNEQALLSYNTQAKVNPPLRTEEDRLALIQALHEGWIDCISTDHAPHSEEEKDCEFGQAEFGIIGFETALALGMKLVKAGQLDLITLIEKLSYKPAEVIGLNSKGRLLPGYDADIILFEPEFEWSYEAKEILSKSKNTPFLGWDFKGKVKYLIKNGQILMADFKIKEVEK